MCVSHVFNSASLVQIKPCVTYRHTYIHEYIQRMIFWTMFTCISMHVYVRIFMYVCIPMHVYVRIVLYACISVHLYVRAIMHLWMYIHACVMSLRTGASDIHMHTHINNNGLELFSFASWLSFVSHQKTSVQISEPKCISSSFVA